MSGARCGPACARSWSKPVWPMWSPGRCPNTSAGLPTITAPRKPDAAGRVPPAEGRQLAARAVGPGQDLEIVTGGVAEVDAATAVVGVELAGPPPGRICPVWQAARGD